MLMRLLILVPEDGFGHWLGCVPFTCETFLRGEAQKKLEEYFFLLFVVVNSYNLMLRI